MQTKKMIQTKSMMHAKSIFELNAKKRYFEGLFTIMIIGFISVVILLYVLYFRKLEFFQDSIFNDIVAVLKAQIASFSIAGSFYVAFFGGLFFIFVPMEAYFYSALMATDRTLLFIIFILGIIVSYSSDYLIGMKMSRISRRFISPKKFYSIKSYLNRYGKAAIFAASAIPMFPSQQITFILGVFRYNKARLFLLTFSGQVIKYLALVGLFALLN
ncbi:VTT domain-containing protein [Candidatus Woesearchaeota archaeon]|nr:VTT domain-containing protein [Candidatus Woesearchaeota archaeon]